LDFDRFEPKTMIFLWCLNVLAEEKDLVFLGSGKKTIPLPDMVVFVKRFSSPRTLLLVPAVKQKTFQQKKKKQKAANSTKYQHNK
jgi:hypothetical protein